MLLPLSKTLVKTLAKNLVKNLTKHIVNKGSFQLNLANEGMNVKNCSSGKP